MERDATTTQFKYKCYDVMGMPTDTVTCTRCGEQNTVSGVRTYARMREWAERHVCKEVGRGA